MTRFTVLWRRDVENDLALLWSNSSRRQEVATAADRIDAELRIDAHRKGVSIPNGMKALGVAPLVAYFVVDADDRKVRVEAIRLLESN